MPITIDGTGTISGVSATGISSSQTIPAASVTQAMLTTAASSIGVSQTWQNVKASRSSGVTYTNSTGKPIFACASVGYSANATVEGTVDGIYMGANGVATSGGVTQVCLLIPNGSTYFFTSNNSGVFNSWTELR